MRDIVLMIKEKVIKNKLIHNFLLIFSGEGIGSVFGFFATFFIINTIGSYQHGVLVGVQTYTNLFYGLFSFKTFQSLIKYLAKSEVSGDVEMSKVYIKWSLLLDIFCLALTLICGFFSRNFVISIMGWDNSISKYCVSYLIVYLLYFQGTSIGVLRFFENYHYVVKANIMCSFVRCLGFLICFLLNKGFIVFFVFDCIGNLLKFIMLDLYTIKTLRQHNLLDFYKVKLKMCPDFLKFSFYSNLTSTIDLPVNQITSLIINKYLGFEATSVYSVFGSLGSIINKLGDPISQVIYPEMNQRISQNDIPGAKRLSYKLKLLMLGVFSCGSVFVITTNALWLHLFITNPESYVIPLILYIAYICYANSSMGTHNLFMALGYVKYNIPILIVVNICYLIVLFYSVQNFGLSGVIITYILQAFAVVFIKEIIMRKRDYRELM